MASGIEITKIKEQFSKVKDKVPENFKDIKDKIAVPSALDAQKFEGNVKLTGHSFFDSLIIAITTIIIGLPAINWFYSIQFKDKVPTIQCFPPATLANDSAPNETVSKADVESLCLYRHTLYAAFFPVLVTFFGFGIAALYFIWRNYNSSKFNLFVSLVNEMTVIKDEQTGKYSDKNRIIVTRLAKIFSNDNTIYRTYNFVKVVQLVSSLIAFLITVFLYAYTYNHSAFLSAFSDHYNVPIFYCKLDQFDFLNASLPYPEMTVPCVEFASLTTSLILLIDIFLLFVIFILTIASIFNFQFYAKELKCQQAAKFSFCTGMSHRLFYAKSSHFRAIDCDLDFLVILLRRTDSGRADTLWDVQTLNEIELLNNDDLMRSDLNYKYQAAHPIFRGSILLLEDKDEDLKLKWDLNDALKPENINPIDLIEPPHPLINLEVPANSFRSAIIGFSAFATRENALYISLDSTSLGVPLALCRVFIDKVYSLNFDPFFKEDTDHDGKLYKVEKWTHNFCRVTFPRGILSSDITKVIKVNDGIEEAGMEDINFIVLGPIEDKTSHKTMLAEILHIISNKLSHECFMLVITPAESFNGVKFFKFTPLNKKRDTMPLPTKMVQEMDAVQLWKKKEVLLVPSDQHFGWPPTLKASITSSPTVKARVTETTELLPHDQRENKSEIQRENKNEIDSNLYGSFMFDLYTYDKSRLDLIMHS